MDSAADQVRIYEAVYSRERDTVNAKAAKRMLETSRSIHQETINVYMHIYRKPVYRISGYLMGFRSFKEKHRP